MPLAARLMSFTPNALRMLARKVRNRGLSSTTCTRMWAKPGFRTPMLSANWIASAFATALGAARHIFR